MPKDKKSKKSQHQPASVAGAGAGMASSPTSTPEDTWATLGKQVFSFTKDLNAQCTADAVKYIELAKKRSIKAAERSGSQSSTFTIDIKQFAALRFQKNYDTLVEATTSSVQDLINSYQTREAADLAKKAKDPSFNEHLFSQMDYKQFADIIPIILQLLRNYSNNNNPNLLSLTQNHPLFNLLDSTQTLLSILTSNKFHLILLLTEAYSPLHEGEKIVHQDHLGHFFSLIAQYHYLQALVNSTNRLKAIQYICVLDAAYQEALTRDKLDHPIDELLLLIKTNRDDFIALDYSALAAHFKNIFINARKDHREDGSHKLYNTLLQTLTLVAGPVEGKNLTTIASVSEKGNIAPGREMKFYCMLACQYDEHCKRKITAPKIAAELVSEEEARCTEAARLAAEQKALLSPSSINLLAMPDLGDDPEAAEETKTEPKASVTQSEFIDLPEATRAKSDAFSAKIRLIITDIRNHEKESNYIDQFIMDCFDEIEDIGFNLANANEHLLKYIFRAGVYSQVAEAIIGRLNALTEISHHDRLGRHLDLIQQIPGLIVGEIEYFISLDDANKASKHYREIMLWVLDDAASLHTKTCKAIQTWTKTKFKIRQHLKQKKRAHPDFTPQSHPSTFTLNALQRRGLVTDFKPTEKLTTLTPSIHLSSPMRLQTKQHSSAVAAAGAGAASKASTPPHHRKLSTISGSSTTLTSPPPRQVTHPPFPPVSNMKPALLNELKN